MIRVSLLWELALSQRTLGLYVLQRRYFHSLDGFRRAVFLLVIQVAFEEKLHPLCCQAQVNDSLENVPARNQKPIQSMDQAPGPEA